ncbi:NADH:ubiquinone oxidoreductase 11.6kD subunit [Beauveria brongniartii RCEF 3172]|uniref:NADH dehydrogenase [ubiquinone] 1 beta subcomplex subunit 11, mitochondrial n=2 Tax=Beauveria TaxID=5581 RepID=A0A167GDE2_9HYPO|nr:NADH:ubiquinone oxidoreductase 11.6kD subunit [Beauveria brongniartii RCEF 3172]
MSIKPNSHPSRKPLAPQIDVSGSPATPSNPSLPNHTPPNNSMAILRHSIAPLRAVRCARQPAAAVRSFSVTANRRGGGHGSESQFEPPSGWLWGIKPGEKPEPEGWEWPMYFFCGSFVVAGVALAFKPDTSVSTWALEEARRRLEAEGVLPDPTASQEKK